MTRFSSPLRRLADTLAVLGLLAGLLVASFPASSNHPIEPASLASSSSSSPDKALNTILLIGDGMGPVHRTAARWVSVGPGGQLAMDSMPVAGLARTSSADALITDSAAAATAMATGVKTYNGAIGVDVNRVPVTTILEQAQVLDKAAGLVTTVQLAHATPAAFAAHVDNRGKMTEIASQILDHQVDVLLGGGEDEFLPTSETGCYPGAGERTDGRNLIQEAVGAGYAYVCDQAAFTAVNPAVTARLLGLFADGGMPRPFTPTLADMTQKAIDILSRDADGFFLMVEGGQIDWASHSNDAANAIGDTIGFDDAVAVALAFAANHPQTLVIVTGDHETGGIAIQSGSGFTTPGGQAFAVGWTSGSHTGVDIPTTAQGPGALGLAGYYENTHIYEAMLSAMTTGCPLASDVNGDGGVDIVDIQWVAGRWGNRCPVSELLGSDQSP